MIIHQLLTVNLRKHRIAHTEERGQKFQKSQKRSNNLTVFKIMPTTSHLKLREVTEDHQILGTHHIGGQYHLSADQVIEEDHQPLHLPLQEEDRAQIVEDKSAENGA